MRKKLLRICAGGLLFAAGFVFGKQWALFTAAYVLAGYDVVLNALRGLFRAQLLDENLLMAVASIGALSLGDFAEGAAVMLFYQIGELFQEYAVRRSRKSITALMELRPDSALRVSESGQVSEVPPEEVEVGDLILLKPGMRAPLDGVIIEGSGALDTAALTGESIPRDACPGDEVLGGSVSLRGALTLRVTRPYAQSAVSRILEMVEDAVAHKARSERFITRFARWYTPSVVGAAVLLAVLPPLLGLGTWLIWLHRALLFLVVSCPCALVISVPLSFFGGIGGASRRGILVKGGGSLEMLAKMSTVVFDKTGTLTQGIFSVEKAVPAVGTEQELLMLAARAEQFSNHPIAASLRDAAGALPSGGVYDVKEQAGGGISALVDGARVLAGNRRLLEQNDVPCPTVEGGTLVYIAKNGVFQGYISIADRIKPEVRESIAALKALGIRRMIMLTGDAEGAAKTAAEKLDLDGYYAGLLPEDKVERLRAELARKDGTVAFVGDGINDAPVLALADVGIAMGGLGSDAAIEAADVVLMTDKLDRLPVAVRIGRKTIAIARQNIVFALMVKGLVLVLGAMGIATMWEAVFADVGVAFLAVCNALRAMYVKK